MPENRLPSANDVLDRVARDVPALQRYIGDSQWRAYHETLREACGVEILKFDRPGRILVVKALKDAFLILRGAGYLDFSLPKETDYAILDPFHVDYFSRKLDEALPRIGRPPISGERKLFQGNPARVEKFKNRSSAPETPAAEFIWRADELAHQATGFDGKLVTQTIRKEDPGAFKKLNDSQNAAIVNSASNRLSLIWGPPGTGKSKTAKALIFGLMMKALQDDRRFRIAVTGPNWTAIDNVMSDLPAIFSEAEYGLFAVPTFSRLTSSRTDKKIHADLHPYVVPTSEPGAHDKPSPRDRLLEGLTAQRGNHIVAGTADQLWNLAKGGPSGLFDMILIDEASQMDMAHALVVMTTLDENASLVVVGDDLQMPPIHPLPAPEDCAHLVGSIYDFYRQYRKTEQNPSQAIAPKMLAENYRSNGEIVGFVREAGYGPEFVSVQPEVRIRLATPVGSKPHDWPGHLPWTDAYARILDPSRSLTAVVHKDIYASQQNEDEARLVAALCCCLESRLEPLNEESSVPMSGRDLFDKGIGIVTPHRAQQAAIIRHLEEAMPARIDKSSIYSAVDTVERFQGQQRAVIIASFGLGDSDQIASEEEFLYSLNRFNVIASRAQAKLVVILSRKLVDHLPRDRDMLRQSRLLKHFVDGYLQDSVSLKIPGFTEECELRYRRAES